MKLFASELGHNYTTYSFAYCLYAQREEGDTLAHMYNAGFLPYSGSPAVHQTAYMARSARIQLKGWEMNSENRRVYRRFELERELKPVAEHLEDTAMFDFCLTYFADRHGQNVMPRERLEYVLHSGWVTHIATYRQNGQIMGYVWLGKEESMSHFYYSFYDLAHVQQSLGLWLMIDCAKRCQEDGQDFLYIGTAYGEKGLYKTNFQQLEFWDGQKWEQDVRILRTHCRLDSERILPIADRWKEEHELKKKKK